MLQLHFVILLECLLSMTILDRIYLEAVISVGCVCVDRRTWRTVWRTCHELVSLTSRTLHCLVLAVQSDNTEVRSPACHCICVMPRHSLLTEWVCHSSVTLTGALLTLTWWVCHPSVTLTGALQTLTWWVCHPSVTLTGALQTLTWWVCHPSVTLTGALLTLTWWVCHSSVTLTGALLTLTDGFVIHLSH